MYYILLARQAVGWSTRLISPSLFPKSQRPDIPNVKGFSAADACTCNWIEMATRIISSIILNNNYILYIYLVGRADCSEYVLNTGYKCVVLCENYFFCLSSKNHFKISNQGRGSVHDLFWAQALFTRWTMILSYYFSKCYENM